LRSEHVRGIYEVAEIRKHTGKPATIHLELYAKMISVEELWEFVEVTDGAAKASEVRLEASAKLQDKPPAAPVAVIGAKPKGAARPPQGLNPDVAQDPAPVTSENEEVAVTAGDEVVAEASVEAGEPEVAVTAGNAEAEKPPAKIDYSFTESLQLDITTFVDGWTVYLGCKVRYSLDSHWPDQKLIDSQRNAASALQGLVHMALWKLGRACSIGIRPEKFIASILEPAPKLCAHPGARLGCKSGSNSPP